MTKVIKHGAVGGVSSVAGGGKVGHGFLSSGFTQAFAPGIDGIDPGNIGQSPARIAAAAIVGGTAAELGGGKFANGAVTGAFSRAFDDELHQWKEQSSLTSATCTSESVCTRERQIYAHEVDRFESLPALASPVTKSTGLVARYRSTVRQPIRRTLPYDE